MLPSTPSTVQPGTEGPASCPETVKQSNLAIFALSLSIMSVLGMVFVVGLVFSIAAVVAGHISYSRIKASDGKINGKGIAAASLIIGYISGFISLMILLVILAFAVPSYLHSLPPREVRQQIAELKKATPAQCYEAAVKKLSAGKQSEAEDLLDAFIRKYPSDQRLLFLYAVCARSRWSLDQSDWAFRKVLKLDSSTLEGNCAQYVLELDERENVSKNMNALSLMIKQNPDNPLLLWVMAIECRDYYKHTGETTYSREAERCYRKLLEMCEVGPVMVHHTFANILSDELNLYEEALKYRRIAVKMEPTAWSYEGLAATLTEMERYDEADRVYAKQLKLAPYNADYWRDWAYSLEKQGRYEECIEKSKMALKINPNYFQAYNLWGESLKKQKKYEEALEIFKKSIKINPAQRYANDETAEILEILGRHAEAQLNVNKAVEWIQQSADRGNAESQCTLGWYYNKGHGVPKDSTKAVEWYRKAAEQGFAKAQYNLGNCYETGNGVAKNLGTAIEWYRKAAEQGFASAQCNLGIYYYKGEGVDVNYKKAVDWCQKGAEQGDAKAQYVLGLCYNYGRGVTQDMVQATDWWRKAAEQGDMDAQHCLGECYAKGDGVPKDFANATKWRLKYLEQKKAQTNTPLIHTGTK